MIINVVPIIISLMLAIFLSVKTKVSSALDFFKFFKYCIITPIIQIGMFSWEKRSGGYNSIILQ